MTGFSVTVTITVPIKPFPSVKLILYAPRFGDGDFRGERTIASYRDIGRTEHRLIPLAGHPNLDPGIFQPGYDAFYIERPVHLLGGEGPEDDLIAPVDDLDNPERHRIAKVRIP